VITPPPPGLISHERSAVLRPAYVWRPPAPAAEPLSVVVFFTGGGNHAFSGQGAPVFGGVGHEAGKGPSCGRRPGGACGPGMASALGG
jgi:hypothetical protein